MHTDEPQPEDIANLYRRAFAEYGARALWNKRFLEHPTKEDALVVARALRVEGDRNARRLAEEDRGGLRRRSHTASVSSAE